MDYLETTWGLLADYLETTWGLYKCLNPPLFVSFLPFVFLYFDIFNGYLGSLNRNQFVGENQQWPNLGPVKTKG